MSTGGAGPGRAAVGVSSRVRHGWVEARSTSSEVAADELTSTAVAVALYIGIRSSIVLVFSRRRNHILLRSRLCIYFSSRLLAPAAPVQPQLSGRESLGDPITAVGRPNKNVCIVVSGHGPLALRTDTDARPEVSGNQHRGARQHRPVPGVYVGGRQGAL